MRQSMRYKILNPTNTVYAGDALYINDLFVYRFRKPGVGASVADHVAGLKQGAFGSMMQDVEVRRKRKQRNRTKAKYL